MAMLDNQKVSLDRGATHGKLRSSDEHFRSGNPRFPLVQFRTPQETRSNGGNIKDSGSEGFPEMMGEDLPKFFVKSSWACRCNSMRATAFSANMDLIGTNIKHAVLKQDNPWLGQTHIDLDTPMHRSSQYFHSSIIHHLTRLNTFFRWYMEV